jgi:putative oxidoreductase
MFDKLRTAVKPYALLPIRLGLGLSMLAHGWNHATGPQALTRAMERADLPATDVLGWVAIGIELLGGVLVLLGFQTRPAALLLLAWLTVDTFLLHWRYGWWADVGGFELPLAHLLCALGLLLGGAGRASVDSIRGKF